MINYLVMALFTIAPVIAHDSYKPIEAYSTIENCSKLMTEGHVQTYLNRDVQQFLTFPKMKFSSAYSFSQKGKYVSLSYDGYPDKVHVEIRALETGELISSFMWIGKDNTLFDIYQINVDEVKDIVVSYSNYFFTTEQDTIVIWGIKENQVIESIDIPKPLEEDFVESSYYNRYNFRDSSVIEYDIPYFFRAIYNHSDTHSSGRKSSVQLINWKSKELVNINEIHPITPSIIKGHKQPFNKKFHFGAFLNIDSKKLEVYSYNHIENLPNKKRMSPQITARNFVKRIGHFLRKSTPGSSQNLLSSRSRDENKSDKMISQKDHVTLAHKSDVQSYYILKEIPLIISITKEGLFLWNALDGNLFNFIPDQEVEDLKVFEDQSILAYITKNNHLKIASLKNGEIIYENINFPHWNLEKGLTLFRNNLYIFNRNTNSVDIVALDNGKVSITKNVFELEKKYNTTYNTIVTTSKDEYLVYISMNDDSIQLDLYSFTTKNLERTFKLTTKAFQSQFKLDPSGRYLIFTSEAVQNDIIDIQNFINDKMP